MKIPFAIIAVFVDEKLEYLGNTAAVVETDKPLSAETMQQLAADFNQPATTFLWKEHNILYVRWFAPDAEIDLCGHGSMAAFAYLDEKDEVRLVYNDGTINGKKISRQKYAMSLEPIISSHAGTPDDAIQQGLNANIKGYYSNSNKNIILLENQAAVQNLEPDFSVLKKMEPFGIIVTAPADDDDIDFVSRTFVPKVRQLEDHATGSSHAALTPFWEERLGKLEMTGLQLSPRGGKFYCKITNNKVELSGLTKIIAKGELS